MAERLDIRTIVETDRMVARLYMGAGDRMIVAFSGIGREAGVVPPAEFPRFATRDGAEHALFISDPGRSWLNAPGLIEEIVRVIEATARELGVRHVFTLGHSMGGFMAAVIPGFTKVERALCLSPQSSVDPSLVPDDPRWMEYRDQIKDFRIRQVADYLSDETEYFVIFGEHGREGPQVRGFLPRENLHLFLMAKTVHETATKLKNAGVLGSLIEYALDGRLPKVRRMLKNALDTYQITEPMRFHRPLDGSAMAAG
ncbi:hypothetical protein ACS3SW_13605 [Roseobacteraceae bacterium S113]